MKYMIYIIIISIVIFIFDYFCVFNKNILLIATPVIDRDFLKLK